jgi:hypothetical protein
LDGEGLKVSPYLGRELARQPVLVRLATASKPFYEAPPEVAGAHPAKAKPHP